MLHGHGGDVFAGEALGVHGAGDGEAFFGAGDEPGLAVQQAGAAAGAQAGGVQADALFADPAHGGAGVAEELHGAVGDAGAGANEHDGDHGGGDADGVAFVDDDDGVLVAVDVAAFDVDAGDAVGDAVQVVGVGLLPDVGHHLSSRGPDRGARVSRPQP